MAVNVTSYPVEPKIGQGPIHPCEFIVPGAVGVLIVTPAGQTVVLLSEVIFDGISITSKLVVPSPCFVQRIS